MSGHEGRALVHTVLKCVERLAPNFELAVRSDRTPVDLRSERMHVRESIEREHNKMESSSKTNVRFT